MFNIAELNCFVAAAEEVHFGRAAARLNQSQSTLTLQIRELEAEVGLKLLHRTTRSVEPTSAGAGFLPLADRLLDELSNAVEDLHALARGERGSVAVVAGATRGAGRGIALALGEAGATVICTGRSSSAQRIPSDYDRPETIEETAAMVGDLGGTGVAHAVDHLDPDQVARLAERIGREHGHIDILVNDIWGGEVLKGGPPEWNRPIWEVDLADGLRILRLAIDTHLVTSHHLLPLMIDRQLPGIYLPCQRIGDDAARIISLERRHVVRARRRADHRRAQRKQDCRPNHSHDRLLWA